MSPKIRCNKKFGCPAYSLSNLLQEGGRKSKWEARERIGINLEPSPRHASSLDLILNLHTGLVYLKFHIQFYDFFNTVRLTSNNPTTFYRWQIISGIKAWKVKSVLHSYGERIGSEPFLLTIEDTRGYDQDSRTDADTHQQDSPEKAHLSGDQDRTKDSSHTSRLARIRHITGKIRENNKSSEVFTSTHKSNKERNN